MLTTVQCLVNLSSDTELCEDMETNLDKDVDKALREKAKKAGIHPEDYLNSIVRREMRERKTSVWVQPREKQKQKEPR